MLLIFEETNIISQKLIEKEIKVQFSFDFFRNLTNINLGQIVNREDPNK